MNHLFLFSIGPVQSFIAQARKTQDLFAGSSLLSALCYEACKKVIAYCEGDEEVIITPHIQKGSIPKNLPNRLLANIPDKYTGEAQLKDFAVNVENTVQNFFEQEAQKAFKEIGYAEAAQQQIKQHLRINWLFQSYEGEEGHFEAVKRIEQRMASIKRLDPFLQYRVDASYGEQGRKCMIDGVRNVILYRRTPFENGSPRKLFTNRCEVIGFEEEKRVNIWELGAGEGLSAVSFTKRKFLQQPHNFPSTAKISLLHLFEKVQHLKSYEALNEKVEGKDKVFRHSDEELYFEDNHTAKNFARQLGLKENDALVREKLKIIQSLHANLRKEMRDKGIKEKFTKYYALVASDGDEMGKWFQGSYFKKDQLARAAHKKLSECLGIYSQRNNDELSIPQGQTIYSGGEDFLGLFNLHFLFEGLRALKDRFEDALNQEIKAWSLPGKKMTISTGIVIAHYKEPLAAVLNQVNRAEKEAKKAGRNRFTITVLKHSGSAIECTVPNDSSGADFLYLMQHITQQLQVNFSATFIVKAHDLHVRFQKTEEEDASDLESYFDSELGHLIGRSNMAKRHAQEDEKVFKSRKKELTLGMLESVMILKRQLQNTARLLDALFICDFIARQTYSKPS